MTTSEMRESRHDKATMATAVATAVVRLDAMEVAVEVTTDSMPPMSLVMRDWTSPVRVRVKKAIDCRCRWPKTLVRSPCMICWPTLVLIQVWITPKAEGTAALPIMPATSKASSRTFLSGRATSMTARSRNGEATPTTEDAAMMAVTMASCQRYGGNSRPMRRKDTSRACAFSAAVTVFGPRVRPPLLMSRFVDGDAKDLLDSVGRARARIRGLGGSLLLR